MNPDSLLVDKAGETVALTIHEKPLETGARTVTVVPGVLFGKPRRFAALQRLGLGQYGQSELGRPAARSAISIFPTPSYPGMESFFRYFYPQIHKEGLIVDIRFNSGGYPPYWMIERLNRSMIYYSRMPYGKAPIKEPGPGFFGPKVCLINEWAESGGENFASIFRLLKERPADRHAGPPVTWPRPGASR